MRYHVGDKFILAGIECQVALVNSYGSAYLVPGADDEDYNNQKTRVGLVFAILDVKGYDRLGNKALAVNNTECGAV